MMSTSSWDGHGVPCSLRARMSMSVFCSRPELRGLCRVSNNCPGVNQLDYRMVDAPWELNFPIKLATGSTRRPESLRAARAGGFGVPFRVLELRFLKRDLAMSLFSNRTPQNCGLGFWSPLKNQPKRGYPQKNRPMYGLDSDKLQAGSPQVLWA